MGMKDKKIYSIPFPKLTIAQKRYLKDLFKDAEGVELLSSQEELTILGKIDIMDSLRERKN